MFHSLALDGGIGARRGWSEYENEWKLTLSCFSCLYIYGIPPPFPPIEAHITTEQNSHQQWEYRIFPAFSFTFLTITFTPVSLTPIRFTHQNHMVFMFYQRIYERVCSGWWFIVLCVALLLTLYIYICTIYRFFLCVYILCIHSPSIINIKHIKAY